MNEIKIGYLIRLTITAQKYCTGFDPSLLENGWSEFLYLLTSDLSWLIKRLLSENQWLHTLNFVRSSANLQQFQF